MPAQRYKLASVGLRREHAARSWQTIQAVLYVAALEQAHRNHEAALWNGGHEWGEHDEQCKTSNALMRVRWEIP